MYCRYLTPSGGGTREHCEQYEKGKHRLAASYLLWVIYALIDYALLLIARHSNLSFKGPAFVLLCTLFILLFVSPSVRWHKCGRRVCERTNVYGIVPLFGCRLRMTDVYAESGVLKEDKHISREE